MKFASAWVSITGKLFIPMYEIEEMLKEKYPNLLTAEEINEDTIRYIDKASSEQTKECFEELAQAKTAEMFPTDDPLKFYEMNIDLKTLHSLS